MSMGSGMGKPRAALLVAALLATTEFCTQCALGDDTFVYAVEIQAAVQESPPRISLQWRPDPYGARSFTIFRKAKDESWWGDGLALPANTTAFVDENVVAGKAYEYQVIKASVPGYKGYGYIYSGIAVPLIEFRGKILLVVASDIKDALASELSRLENDLIGDGWMVLRLEVSPGDSPHAVRERIRAEYYKDPSAVNTVLLFGHVPIYQSAKMSYDGHTSRTMPADSFYGDMDGNWNVPPVVLPTDVELMVGRVDFYDMPGEAAPGTWPGEVELLRRYLNKNHAWRHKYVSAPRRALMGNRRGDERGLATAASGYRMFAPLVGLNGTVEANVDDVSNAWDRWMPTLAAQDFLLAYGCGAGQRTSVSYLGTRGIYKEVWSTDVVNQGARAVFTMLFGSWLGNWDWRDNILRSFLASPALGLASCMGGQPHVFFHHTALGEPLGYGIRVSMNNSTLYKNDYNEQQRAVFIALMGDPSLRLDVVAPPSALVATAAPGTIQLRWNPSPDTVLGYHVYRSTWMGGYWTRRTDSPLQSTSFTDSGEPGAHYVYMVRAVKLEQNFSGSFYNASQGLFAAVDVPQQVAPIRLNIAFSNGRPILSWAATPGGSYRVLAWSTSAPSWQDASGPLIATESVLAWTDWASSLATLKYYRVVSP